MPLSERISKMTKRGRITLLIVIIVAFIALMVGLAFAIQPLINWMSEPENLDQIEEWISNLGIIGVIVMFVAQVAQIIIAFIPGELVQIIAGVLYGVWGGLLLCFVGCVVASSVVFLVIRKYGQPLVERIIGKEQLERFSFLNDSSKLNTLVFLLFLIPGMPKDILTYIVPLSPMKFRDFIILSNVARLPGMIASTLMGSSIMSANWPLIIGIFVVVAAIALLAIWQRDNLMNFAKRMGGVKEDKTSAETSSDTDTASLPDKDETAQNDASGNAPEVMAAEVIEPAQDAEASEDRKPVEVIEVSEVVEPARDIDAPEETKTTEPSAN